MRLYEKYRPKTLGEITGQPPVKILQRLAAEPYPTCILLEGPPGTGKTASAMALAYDLGCDPDELFSGLIVVNGSELGVSDAKELLERTLRLRCGHFKCLIIEELEWLSPQCQVYLKTALETRLPQQLIVVATSNNAVKLSKALLQRFKTYTFNSGPHFRHMAQERLREVWERECSQPMIPGWEDWGIDEEGDFSMRVAFDKMQDAITMQEVTV